MYDAPPSPKRGITLAMILLGACAIFAVMNSFDAGHTAAVVGPWEEVKETPNPAPTTTMTQVTSNDEIEEMESDDADISAIDQKQKAEETALKHVGVATVSKSDSLSAWMNAKTQATKVSHAAKKLKKSAKKASKLLHKKRAADRKQQKRSTKAQKQKKHKRHQKLRKAAAKATAQAVQKALKRAWHGVGHLASKAATRAAKSVVRADKKKKAKAEAVEAIATKKEGEVQKLVDRLGSLRRQIRSIQMREVKVRQKAKIRAHKYALDVENHVKRARQHFEAMRRLLKEFQKAVKVTSEDKVHIARLFATLKVLRKRVKLSKDKLAKLASKKHRERRHKRRAKAQMRKSRRHLKRHYKTLLAALRRQISREKARKSRPDRNGQLRLNQLNVKSQTLVVKLSDRMQIIRGLKRRLAKQRARDKTEKLKSKKRKQVLQVAQSAYNHLDKAVARLRKIVAMNKARDKIKSVKGAGLAFTKSLLRAVHKSVKKAIKKSKHQQLKHYSRKH